MEVGQVAVLATAYITQVVTAGTETQKGPQDFPRSPFYCR